MIPLILHVRNPVKTLYPPMSRVIGYWTGICLGIVLEVEDRTTSDYSRGTCLVVVDYGKMPNKCLSTHAEFLQQPSWDTFRPGCLNPIRPPKQLTYWLVADMEIKTGRSILATPFLRREKLWSVREKGTILPNKSVQTSKSDLSQFPRGAMRSKWKLR